MMPMDPNYQGIPQQPQAPVGTQPQVTFMAPPPPRRSVGLIVTSIVSTIFALGFAGLGIWAYISYTDEKTDVEERIELAAASREKAQKEADAIEYAKRLKEPYWKFDGPADYGGLSFKYPKTWDVYVAKEGRDGKGYEAYLDKGTVPPVSDKQQFGLRVTITNTSYDKVVGEYDDQVKKNELKSSAVKVNGQDGIRFDGNFTKDLRGSAVIFKIRDKTLIMQTDINSGEIKDDFEALIKTVTFNT